MTRPSAFAGALWAVTCSFAVGACGADDGGPVELRCDMEDRAVTYEPGMMIDGDEVAYTIRLVQSTPAPPSKGDNTWVIDVLDHATLSPVDGAAITVFPFMPDHGHGTAVEAIIEPTAQSGQFRVDRINLWMPGFWEVNIYVDVGDVMDTVVFPVCIEG